MRTLQYINQKNDVEIRHFGSTMLEGYKQYCKEGAITLILGEVELLKLSGNLLSKTKIGKAVLDKGGEYLSHSYMRIQKEIRIFTGRHQGLAKIEKLSVNEVLATGNVDKITKALRGEGFKLPEKALEKIPQSLTDKYPIKFNDRGIGIKIGDRQNSIRIDKGVPKSRYGKILQPHEKVDHVKVIRNGQIIGRDGKPIIRNEIINGETIKPSNNPRAHIPLKEWLNWKSGLEK